MTYYVYKNNVKDSETESTEITLSNLTPATPYKIGVSDVVDGNESDPAELDIITNGRLTIPSTKEIVSIMYSENCIDLEAGGFDTSGQFGGTTPVSVPIRRNTISGTSRIIEVDAKYHMNDIDFELVTTNKYLSINENKSIEITVK